MADAIVIGAGPNGLVAANRLADAGWEVTVVEEQDEPGGAVRSAELIERGYVSDLFSSFYPLAVASPALRRLDLTDHGLRWVRSRTAVAHPARDGTCAIVSTDLDETISSLDSFSPGDGEAWRRLYRLWELTGDEVYGGRECGEPAASSQMKRRQDAARRRRRASRSPGSAASYRCHRDRGIELRAGPARVQIVSMRWVLAEQQQGRTAGNPSEGRCRRHARHLHSPAQGRRSPSQRPYRRRCPLTATGWLSGQTPRDASEPRIDVMTVVPGPPTRPRSSSPHHLSRRASERPRALTPGSRAGAGRL
ncbi:MAG: FAD-dependent oxidoreductase [Solirubrobacterales bacterium]|nr:FAD-dependent oxidoreductase [Solirubrobacterales bacterium]